MTGPIVVRETGGREAEPTFIRETGGRMRELIGVVGGLEAGCAN